MAFAPPRKAAPSPLHKRSPSCPAIMTRERNPSGSSRPTARSIFTSTPTARGRGGTSLSTSMKRPSPIVVANGGKGASRSISSRITTTPSRNRRRRSNSLEINDSRLSKTGGVGGFQNLSQNRQSTLIEDPPAAAGDSNLSTISTVSSISSVPKVIIGGPGGLTTNSNINNPKKLNNPAVPLLQPKLSQNEMITKQNEMITKQNEQKELELLKLKLNNARLKYLNTAVLYSVTRDTSSSKFLDETLQAIKSTVDVGLIQTRNQNMIDTCKARYCKDKVHIRELNSLQDKLTKVKDLIGSPEFATKLHNITEHDTKKYNFIPIKNIEFDKENDTASSRVEECFKTFKEMNLCSSTNDKDKVPTVFSALVQPGQLTEQKELIKKEKELLNIYREKLIERSSLKSSLNSVKK